MLEVREKAMQLTGENLTCKRGGRIVIARLNFSVARGEALLLSGANGSGKSTLLRLIAGYLSPSAGRLALKGGAIDMPIGAQCHYCGHLDALKPSLTVRENLGFWQAWFGASWYSIDEALVQFNIDHLADLPLSYLSAGQRRRLSLARLLVAKRPIWLLDEPTSALDRQSVDQFCVLLRQHIENDGMLIAATHLPLKLDGAKQLDLGGGE